MYWVTVTPFGPGEGGHGAPLWADVEDIEREGTLILKDRISGRGKSDSTDSDIAMVEVPLMI